MARLIDSSLWIDLFRSKTPRSVKEQVRREVLHRDACLCGPIAFEVLREARKDDRSKIEAQFATMPYLSQPSSLWETATRLGQQCRDGGVTPGAIDLAIGAIGIERSATIVTFDRDFLEMAKVSELQVELLTREMDGPLT
ncbi:MAG: PIN domain-containing protein [Verrucomicrobiaceae bacterium]